MYLCSTRLILDAFDIFFSIFYWRIILFDFKMDNETITEIWLERWILVVLLKIDLLLVWSPHLRVNLFCHLLMWLEFQPQRWLFFLFLLISHVCGFFLFCFPFVIESLWWNVPFPSFRISLRMVYGPRDMASLGDKLFKLAYFLEKISLLK